jgi:hypothetical protein
VVSLVGRVPGFSPPGGTGVLLAGFLAGGRAFFPALSGGLEWDALRGRMTGTLGGSPCAPQFLGTNRV